MFSGFGLNFETLSFFGLVIAGFSYVVNQWRSGGGKAQKDLIETLTTQLKAQKEINESLQAQITELTGKIGKLEGINQANDQKIKEYLQIIANRNPELEATLTAVEEAVRAFVPFMDDIRAWNEEIRRALQMPPVKPAKPTRRKNRAYNTGVS